MKYLAMTRECHECEQDAADTEMAKRGLVWCSECDNCVKWNELI